MRFGRAEVFAMSIVEERRAQRRSTAHSQLRFSVKQRKQRHKLSQAG
jgi:hypothetical protein